MTTIQKPSFEDTLDGNLENEMDDELSEILSQNELPLKTLRKPSLQQNYQTISTTQHKDTMNENIKLKREIMQLKEEIFKTSQIKANNEDQSQMIKSTSKLSAKSGKSDFSVNLVNNALSTEQKFQQLQGKFKQLESHFSTYQKKSQDQQNLLYSIMVSLVKQQKK